MYFSGELAKKEPLKNLINLEEQQKTAENRRHLDRN